MNKHNNYWRIVFLILVLTVTNGYMLYVSSVGLFDLVRTFSSDVFHPLILRPYLVPYYCNAIAMLIMFISSIMSFVEGFKQNSGKRICLWGMAGLVASIAPRIMAFFLFGTFSLHYMSVAPVCVLAIGFWKMHIEKKQHE